MGVEKQVLRGFISTMDVYPPLIVTFQFNPISVSDNKAVNYSDRYTSPNDDAPRYFYTGGGDRSISFDIQLHGLEQGLNASNPSAADNGISTELAKLRSFLYPKSDAWGVRGGKEGRSLNSPPACLFGFGSKILECIVRKLDITETQFNSLLAPVRADVKINLIVIGDKNSDINTYDREHRNYLSAMGLQNTRIYR